MAGFTNRGKFLIVGSFFANSGTPTSFSMALCTDAVAPDADTNVLSDLTEIAVGNGYSAGGELIARNLTTGFETLTEDDANDYGYIRIQDVTFLATGGPIPSSGDGARYAVLIDDSDNVIAFFDLVSAQVVSDGQSIFVQNSELRLEE